MLFDWESFCYAAAFESEGFERNRDLRETKDGFTRRI